MIKTNPLSIALAIVASLTACSSGHRSDRHLQASPGASPGATGYGGSYLGAYASATDNGLIGIRVRADQSFEAASVSSVDPDLTEFASGVVAPDGRLVVAQTANGTVLSASLATLSGTYQSPIDSGTFTLTPSDPALVEGCYAGDWIGGTVTGRGVTIVDNLHTAHAVVWDATGGFLSADIAGSVTASGSDWTLNASNLTDGMLVVGTISGGAASGTWTSSALGTSGSWDGEKLP